MFERFTAAARACVERAEQEARELGHNYVGTEHLLIALAADPEGAAGRVLRGLGVMPEGLRGDVLRIVGPGALNRDALASIGIDLDEVRRRVEDAFGPGALEGAPACGGERRRIPFTPRSKKALERSLRVAVHLGDRFIASEHLLLGLTAVGNGLAARMLAERGIDRQRLEAELERARSRAGEAPSG